MSVTMFIRLPALLAAGLLLASPALAVTITSTPGNAALAPGENLVISFDVASATGISNTTIGNVITAAGSTSGVRAAPVGTPQGGVYQSIGNGASSTFDFTGFVNGGALKTLSVYWGSVDRFNFVDFLNGQGQVVSSFSGAALPQNDGNQQMSATNRRVFFNFLPQEEITSLRFRSTGNAFEFDSIGASAGPVPEPATWATLIIGFSFIGYALRQRRRSIASVTA